MYGAAALLAGPSGLAAQSSITGILSIRRQICRAAVLKAVLLKNY
jgi:hypothetical protein